MAERSTRRGWHQRFRLSLTGAPSASAVASSRPRVAVPNAEAPVDSDLTTLQSHAIAETVRHAIFHEVPKISDVVVHVDPCDHAEVDPHRTTSGHLPIAPRPMTPPPEPTDAN